MTTILRQRMIEDMQVRNLSPQTQSAYVMQVSLFARHFNKSPAILGPEDIRAYQLYLTNEKRLAASSIKVAVAALRFIYKVTLKRPWDIDEIVQARRNRRICRLFSAPRRSCIFSDAVRTSSTGRS
jgi:integrase/recombinase XerD